METQRESQTHEHGASAPATVPKELALSTITKAFFQPDNLGNAQTAIANAIAICDANSVKPKWNFDVEAEIPSGFGLAVLPTNIRDDKLNKNICIGCWIAIIPTVALIRANEKGAAFLDMAAQDRIITYFNNAVRPKRDKDTGNYISEPNSVPASVDDYISAGRRESALKFFNEIADKYIKLLKKSGFTNLKKDMFRQVLSSASFAQTIYSDVPQEQWSGLLQIMIAEAENNPEYDAGMLHDWLATRAETSISLTRENTSIDLAALANLAIEESLDKDGAPAAV